MKKYRNIPHNVCAISIGTALYGKKLNTDQYNIELCIPSVWDKEEGPLFTFVLYKGFSKPNKVLRYLPLLNILYLPFLLLLYVLLFMVIALMMVFYFYSDTLIYRNVVDNLYSKINGYIMIILSLIGLWKVIELVKVFINNF